jgi:hypothetical protein
MTTVFPLGFPPATTFYLVLMMGTLVLHMVFMHYVLAGTAYLACGRFMGPKRCAVCGWQAILIDWLPFATGLAITAGVAPLLFVQILYQRAFYSLNLLLSHRWIAILPVLIVCFYLLYLQKSAWITRRAWFWRIPVAAAAFAGFAFIAYSWTENHLLSLDEEVWPELYAAGSLHYTTAGLLPRLGVWFFAAFVTLAVELAWQGRLLGMELVQPPPGSTTVMGLSAVRRLALTASSGGLGVIGCGVAYASTLPADTRGLLGGPFAGPWLWVAVLGLGLQLACWGWVAVRDRLPLPLLLVMTAGWLLSLIAGVVVREALRVISVDMPTLAAAHEEAATIGGLPAFLLFAAANAVAIGWCIRTAAKAT